MESNKKIEVLKQKLAFFGLNPKQWNVIRASSLNEWYIINIKNKSHCLKGISSISENQQPYWKDIELNSF